MATLDLYSKRQPHKITLEDFDKPNEPREYLIPQEFTVEETELLYAEQARIEELSQQEINETEESKELQQFYEAVLCQLIILFRRYQPTITLENLKKIMTRDEALQVWAFFINERIGKTKEAGKTGKKKAAKKSSVK